MKQASNYFRIILLVGCAGRGCRAEFRLLSLLATGRPGRLAGTCRSKPSQPSGPLLVSLLLAVRFLYLPLAGPARHGAVDRDHLRQPGGARHPTRAGAVPQVVQVACACLLFACLLFACLPLGCLPFCCLLFACLLFAAHASCRPPLLASPFICCQLPGPVAAAAAAASAA